MRQSYVIFLLLFLTLRTSAQTERDKLVGDWKCYLKDKSSFEFLRLNSDGTGLKCFGQTIDARDSLFLNHVTTLLITNWRIEKGKLFLDSKNTVSFKVNSEYSFQLDNQNNLKLEGEHLIFYLYPSYLNRKEFQRTITYQKAEKTPSGYGVNTASCIVKQRNLFSFHPIDSLTQLAEYKGFDDLIPYIVACNHGYEYTQKYHDAAYSLIIPKSVRGWSFGFGNKNFYIRFDSEDDKPETSIVIYYDFDDEMKDFYFSEIKEGKEKKNIVRQNNLDIYKTTNWEGKHEGKVFLPNSIIVAYYTRDKKLEEILQNCIVSFKYK
jgi:hypothetical protein